MKIQLISDLHIEYSNYVLPFVDADIIIFAGDIHNDLKGIDYIKKYKNKNNHIIYIPGNHEYYGKEITKTYIEMKKYAKENNIVLLDNEIFKIDDYIFIGSTLWSNFELYNNKEEHIRYYANYAKEKIKDFNSIIFNGNWFSPGDSIRICNISINYIEQKLEEFNKNKKIVITHFSPSFNSVATKYQGSNLNPYFSNNIDKIIKKSDYWFHGHTHDSYDYMVDKCRVVCNPRGYSKKDEKHENQNFNEKLIINI